MLSVAETLTTAKRTRVIKDDPQAAANLWLDIQLAEGRNGVHSIVGKLTPALASLLLSRNPDNRRVSADAVGKYARDITNGDWRFNGEPIVVAQDGLLNDGQHRCEAVVMADLPIDAIFVFGVERDTRLTLDQGKIRTAGDYLGMHGHVDANVLAAVATYVWQFRKFGRIYTASAMRPTKSEVLKVVASTPGLGASITGIPAKGSQAVGGRSLLAFCHFVFADKAGESEATWFCNTLMSGAALPARSPILYVRNRMIEARRLDVNERAELIFRAWNAHRRGEQPRTLPVLNDRLPIVEK